ncbi:hypothetical protein H0E87_025832 [Populus deltoides]|uniref:Uncharacterized protein n=1 Tax=Populus deltoides TaxID=3696 RepID=A0A8T2X3N1_POPDE|nr:hypothetical protein H0E87_025832 [Populus deltoides]
MKVTITKNESNDDGDLTRGTGQEGGKDTNEEVDFRNINGLKRGMSSKLGKKKAVLHRPHEVIKKKEASLKINEVMVNDGDQSTAISFLSIVDEILVGERSVQIQRTEVQEPRTPKSSYWVEVEVVKDNFIEDDVEAMQAGG